MNYTPTEEEVEHVRSIYGSHNIVEHIKKVRRLFKFAKPNNWAWHRLINQYGFDADYSPGNALVRQLINNKIEMEDNKWMLAVAAAVVALMALVVWIISYAPCGTFSSSILKDIPVRCAAYYNLTK